MGEMTDPIRELVTVCVAVRTKLNLGAISGSAPSLLAFRIAFEDLNDQEFMELLAEMHRQIVVVRTLINGLDLEADLVEQAETELAQIQQSLTPYDPMLTYADLRNWMTNAGMQSLRFLSPLVRYTAGYEAADPEEVEQLQADIRQLLIWLNEHQLRDNDFIRAALIEGLEKLEFRLKHFQWFGRRYSVESLRDVMSAYIALEHMGLNAADNPDAEAVLAKTKAFVTDAFQKLKIVKDVGETGTYSLVLLGAAITAATPAVTTIAGLLK